MKKTNYSKVLLLLVILVFSFSLVAIAAIDENPPGVSDQTDGDYVPIDSAIKVKFDKNVALNTNADIKLYNTTGGANDVVEVKSVKTLGDTLYITPKYYLGVGQDFRVDVTANSVVNAAYKTAGNAAPITFTFQTDFYDFEDTMTNAASPSSLENLIAGGLSTREIKIAAPKKYITDIEVLHKKAGSITGSVYETFGAISIIDIKADKDVDHVTISIDGGAPTNAALVESGSSKIFSKTLTGLANDFDVTIIAYNKYNMVVDTQIVNIASTTDAVVTKKAKFTSSTAGKVFTLYDLLARPSNFEKLLNENAMDKLMVQVAE